MLPELHTKSKLISTVEARFVAKYKAVYPEFLDTLLVGMLFSFILSICLAVGVFAFTDKVYAQAGVSSIFSGISVTIPWEEDPVEEGSVVVIEEGKFTLCKKSYDENIYGVIVQSTALSLADRTLEEAASVRVVSSAEAYVRVSSINGDIQAGDYLTTSEMEGVAQLADISGYILGIALEDYSSQDVEEVGSILAHVDIKSAYVPQRAHRNLLQFLSVGALSPIMSPLTSFRYLLSALVVVASFIVGFSSFGKISSQSVESMGRNPLAGRDIKSVVVFNFIFTFGIMLAGIVLSYLVLVL